MKSCVNAAQPSCLWPRLAILDLDQTLVERYTATPLHGVAAALEDLARGGTRMIIATNQAGPAWRLWTGKNRFPNSAQVCARFEAVAEVLPILLTATWLVAVHDARVSLTAAQFEQLAMTFNEESKKLDIRASSDPAWRKPEPGMLWEACRIAGVRVQETRFIGDMDSDAQAARQAGIPFCRTSEFLSVMLPTDASG